MDFADACLKKSYENGLIEFLNLNSLALLQIITDYLRKLLKIPRYSAMYDADILREESEKMFLEDPSLEKKLGHLKEVIVKVRDMIKTHEEVHVSFGVFESFNSLANAPVREYRGIDTLKGVKSSFLPSFDN